MDVRLRELLEQGLTHRQAAGELDVSIDALSSRVRHLRAAGVHIAKRHAAAGRIGDQQVRQAHALYLRDGLTLRQAGRMLNGGDAARARRLFDRAGLPRRDTVYQTGSAWSSMRDELLIGLLADGATYEQAAGRLGVSVEQVRARRRFLRRRGIPVALPARSRLWTVEMDELLIGLLADGVTYEQAAARFGVSREQVSRHVVQLRARGARIPPRRRTRMRWTAQLDRRLLDLLAEGARHVDVAEQMGVRTLQVTRRVAVLRARGQQVTYRRERRGEDRGSGRAVERSGTRAA